MGTGTYAGKDREERRDGRRRIQNKKNAGGEEKEEMVGRWRWKERGTENRERGSGLDFGRDDKRHDSSTSDGHEL